MGVIKKLLRPRVIIWAAVSIVLTGVLIAANILATKQYKGLLENVLGADIPIVKEGDTGIVFEQEFKTKEEARENGNAVTEKICEEGMILLKNENNALPLQPKARVSVFGKNSVNLVYGGSGSAAPDGKIPKKTIYDSLTAAGIAYNPTLKSFYDNNSKSGDGRGPTPDLPTGGVGTLPTGETPIASYTSDITDSYESYGDAALVVISRIAGENWDLPTKAKDNASRHYLELDNNERDLLEHIVKSNDFDHIILLVNGSNYIDLGFLKMPNDEGYTKFGNKIDGAIVIGSPGSNGIMALGPILTGEVNPSGHTVDTIYTNYKNDPTFQNFGDGLTSYANAYKKESGGWATYYLVEYEENIYQGYRYYETRGQEMGEAWYNNNVVYPFGYGLSYTTFSEEIVNTAALSSALTKDPFEVQVKVKNTGEKAGKQVVQIYAQAPYTAGGIEKAHKVLVGFAKTKLLAKNEEETLKITIDPYSFASFDNHDKNNNGFKGYELDGGDYIFHVALDAHHDISGTGTFTKNLAAEGLRYEKDPVTDTIVEPLFNEVSEHMAAGQLLTRSDFKQMNPASFPVGITNEERTVSDEFVAKLASYDSTNNETYDTMPTTNAPYTVALRELAGKAYDDPLWDAFLDQLTPSEMLKLFNDGCYSTAAILRDITVTEIDKETSEEKQVTKKDYPIIPATTSADGPTGFVNFMGKTAVKDCCYYMSECLLAQTYNLELATEQAHALGNESLVGDGTLPYPGWYAPAVNLHRSPFSGRNTEYYSEDPFISGKFAAQMIRGVQEKGVYCNLKHFAVNDQETNRSNKGLATWLDEQALRELYLKPFEMAVKEGDTHGVMTSFNRIGTEWTGGSYRLCTTILRKEWGFKGTVICDFKTDKYMDSKQMLYAGGDISLVGAEDLKLQTSGVYNTPSISFSNAKDVSLLRRSAHNNLYAIANSNIMRAEITGYKLATWKVLFYVADGVIGGLLVLWGAAVIVTSILAKPKKKKGEEEEQPAEEVPAAE